MACRPNEGMDLVSCGSTYTALLCEVRAPVQGQGQEGGHRGGVGVCLGVGEPRRGRIPPHVRPRLPHQVRERHHRRELPGGEELPVLEAVPTAAHKVDVVFVHRLFRLPRRLRLPGDSLVLLRGRQVHPTPARVGHDRHEARIHPARLPLLFDVVVGDRGAGKEAAEERAADLGPGLRRLPVWRSTGAHAEAPGARRPVHHRLEVRLAPLLAREPERAHQGHLGPRAAGSGLGTVRAQSHAITGRSLPM
jgi:hypothetical protein